VFGVLRAAGINVEQTENVVFAGAEAACARIQVAQAPQAGVLDEIRRDCADVLSVSVRAL
jgi:D-3-phosphoglycerate dehydrogenase